MSASLLVSVCGYIMYMHIYLSVCIYAYIYMCMYAHIGRRRSRLKRSCSNGAARPACEELNRGIHALVAKVPKVGELMENTEMFVTTTTIGHELWTVLLYPPTECRRSGRSFG